MPKPAIVLAWCLALLSAGWGIVLAAGQHRRISGFRPIAATIVSAEAVSAPGGRGLEPRITYRYQVGADTCDSTTLFPMLERGGNDWTRLALARFRPGQVHTAYYHPRDPRDSFLIREYLLLFYLLPFIGMALLCSLLLWDRVFSRNVPAGLVAAPDGRFEAPAAHRLSARRRGAWTIALAWHGAALLSTAHYFLVSHSADHAGLLLFGLFEAAGLFPVILGVRYQILGRRLSDARIILDPESAFAGEQLRLRLELDFLREATITGSRVGLFHQDQRGFGHAVHEKWLTLTERRRVRPGEMVREEVRFTIPHEVAFDPRAFEGRRFTWWIAVEVCFSRWPCYRGEWRIPIAPRVREGALVG